LSYPFVFGSLSLNSGSFKRLSVFALACSFFFYVVMLVI
jgi:hypothetical protein